MTGKTGYRSPLRLLCTVALLRTFAAQADSGRTTVPVSISVGSPASAAAESAAIVLTSSAPSTLSFYLHSQTSSWFNASALDFDLFWPGGASTNAQVLVHMMDWDYLWFQNLLAARIVPGEWNHLHVDLSPAAVGWEPRGHQAVWHARCLMQPREFGIRVFYDGIAAGTCRVERVIASLARDTSAPYLRDVRANAETVPCYEKFELNFQVPDRYSDPFDAEQVSVTAEFETPAGKTIQADGFYGQEFFRTVDTTGEETVPQGPPVWRVRFSPMQPGVYRYRLRIRDRQGEAAWGPASFTATPARLPGFVRVSAKDHRYFEFDNGAFFFPIGHNVRSTFDTRMDDQFPWVQRWPEGSAAYLRYFRDMHEHGEDMAEVWTASWSLGLEWLASWPGYHGVGQYNMRNAWELDEVVDEAERQGIYINLVLNNHGKFSTFSDQEWDNNPFNVANGGYLKRPEEFFSDPRAMKAFRKLMRYMIARWGYSTRIFAWELWSELDLTGSRFGGHREPEVTDWHRLMGRAIKDMDPYDHMIATHVCGDYTHQSEDIISLPEIDFCPVNAYHFSPNPLHLINLLRATVNYNVPFGKPVIVTEFGGSHMAEGIKHLSDGLHAGLWASTCLPLGGTPLFWWWQVVEEQDLYPQFTAVSRFMQGEDRRDPTLVPVRPALSAGTNDTTGLDALCLRSPTRAVGWIYHGEKFSEIDPQGPPVVTNLVVILAGVSNTAFRAEFWDTTEGKPVAQTVGTAESGSLRVVVPPFARDIAFKVKPVR